MFKLGHIELVEPSIALITDSTGMMNLKWYLDIAWIVRRYHKKSDNKFSVNQITINEGRFDF